MTKPKAPHWREESKLHILKFLLLIAALMSIFSTMSGFHKVFFPGSLACACAASFLVQGIELALADQWTLPGSAAFLLSVAFSALAFLNVSTSTAAYMEQAVNKLNAEYSTQLLPTVQAEITADLDPLYDDISARLTALRAEAQKKAPSSGTADSLSAEDYAAIRSRYSEKQKKLPIYTELDTVLVFLESSEMERAEALMEAILNETGTTAALRMAKEDVAALKNRLSAYSADPASCVDETAHTIQRMLAQNTIDPEALSAQADALITAALDADLGTDAMPLRSQLQTYIQLLELNTELSRRVEALPGFSSKIQQAAALPDAETAWAEVKALWQTELDSLRTALACSPLSTRTTHMETIDSLTVNLLDGNQNIVRKGVTLLFHMPSITSFSALVLALMLDSVAVVCIKTAKELRRQRAAQHSAVPFPRKAA